MNVSADKSPTGGRWTDPRGLVKGAMTRGVCPGHLVSKGDLNPDFQEFLRSFVDHDVRFLIVGGYALAAHGHPRYTKVVMAAAAIGEG